MGLVERVEAFIAPSDMFHILYTFAPHLSQDLATVQSYKQGL